MADSNNNNNKNNDSIITGTGTERSNLLKRIFNGVKNNKTATIAGGLLVLVITVIVGLIIILPEKQGQQEVTIDSVYELTEDGTPITYKQKAEQLDLIKGPDVALTFLEQVAAEAQNNPEAQAEFYLKAVEIALNGGNYQKALEYAEQSEKIHPSLDSAVALATSAEISGNLDLATEFYKLVLERTPEEYKLNPENSGYRYYENKLKALTGQESNEE